MKRPEWNKIGRCVVTAVFAALLVVVEMCIRDRCHVRGLVAYTDNPGFYRVRYALPKTPRVQAVIPGEFSHAERRWLEARLQAATAYPDFHVCVGREAEGLIEALAAGSREPEGFVLFLNPSVYPMNRGWLRAVSYTHLADHSLQTGFFH